MKNKDSNKNVYKTLLIITVLIFFTYALLTFSVANISNLLNFGLFVLLYWMQFGILLASIILLITLYLGAKKGKVLAIPKKVNKYPVIRIFLISLFVSVFVVFGGFFCYHLFDLISEKGGDAIAIALGSCIGRIKDLSIEALYIFSFVFINLTIAWFIAKRQNRKQGEEESKETKL